MIFSQNAQVLFDFIMAHVTYSSSIEELGLTVSYDVYQFSSVADFLKFHFKEQKLKDPRYSYRRLARRLGINSPSLLAMIVAGQRKPSTDFISRISEKLQLSNEQQTYLESLTGFDRAKSVEEKAYHLKKLRKFKSTNPALLIDLDQFETVANWYHMAILEMTKLKDFRNDARWISERLAGKVSPTSVQEAIERLLRIELLKTDKDGRLKKSASRTQVESKTPSRAIRSFHHQMITMALGSIESQNMEERILSGIALTINPKKIPLAKTLISEFINNFSAQMGQSQGQETYQLAVQFFKLTKGTYE
jgi:uncharacterized protein (TIGR02147 family)